MNALDGLAVLRFVAQVMADGHGQLLLLRLFVGGHDAAHAGGVGGHGLLQEHVLAGLHRGLEVHGAKTRRRAEQHHVDPAVDRLLVGVQAR